MKPSPALPPGKETSLESAARDRILGAAHRCFERFGVSKTTMEDVARAAEYSRQTVYKHFPSKADLVTAICLVEAAKLNVEIHRSVHRRRSLATRIAESILVAIRIARKNAYYRHLIEPLEIRARLTDPRNPVYALQRERWAPMLLEAQASGELASDLDIDEVVTWLTLAQMALLVQFEHPDGDAELERMVRRFVVAPLLGKAVSPMPSAGRSGTLRP
jgi:AcrR family transcriptional regulator